MALNTDHFMPLSKRTAGGFLSDWASVAQTDWTVRLPFARSLMGCSFNGSIHKSIVRKQFSPSPVYVSYLQAGERCCACPAQSLRLIILRKQHHDSHPQRYCPENISVSFLLRNRWPNGRSRWLRVLFFWDTVLLQLFEYTMPPASNRTASRLVTSTATANSISPLPIWPAITSPSLLGKGDGTFTAAPSPATGKSPNGIVVGDFNGDGKLDLAVANEGSNSLTILLGNGDGTFRAAASPATGATPFGLVAGDFNGDGKLDLAVTNQGSKTVTILLGNGDGTFTPASASPATGSVPMDIVAGDWNGDGKLDLAVTNYSSSSVTILLGNGDGTFTAAASPSVSWPEGIAVGDFDGDGKLDLAVTSNNTLSILLSNGDGTFTAAPSPATPNAVALAVGDFNGDGKMDIAATDFGNNTVTILLGNGNGTFTAAPSLTASADPTAMAAGDFNGDGKMDLVVATNGSAGSVTILMSK